MEDRNIAASHAFAICKGSLCMTETTLMGENGLYYGARQAIRRQNTRLDDDIDCWCAVPTEGRVPSRLAPGNRV